MTFALSIGSYLLTNFLELNLRWCRRVFGEVPIIVYDGLSENSPRMQEIATEHGCAYLTETVNRSHFAGDIQNAVTAIAFAKHHQCDIAVKINQRTILLSERIPKLLEYEFLSGADFVTPGQYPESSILEPASRFHARFPHGCDLLAFRAERFNAQDVADGYERQWRLGQGRYDAYAETYWINVGKAMGDGHHRPDWLTVPQIPSLLLRKIQATPTDYSNAAVAVGMPVGSFPVEEWGKLRKGSYRPSPR